MATPHDKYLALADAIVGFAGKRVLEVGGCSPIKLLQDLAPKNWTSIDLNRRAIESFLADAEAANLEGFSAQHLDICKYDSSDVYDLIYSINAFEHIRNLDVALSRMWQALKPGGHLFTLYGPLWSSDVGHHLSVKASDGRILHFNDNILEPWEHLTSTRGAMLRKIEQQFGAETAAKVVDYVYDYPDLNRMFEHEYWSLLGQTEFDIVLKIRRRKGRAPSVPGASNTREILLVLKKGRAGVLERLSTFSRFSRFYLDDTVGRRLRIRMGFRSS